MLQTIALLTLPLLQAAQEPAPPGPDLPAPPETSWNLELLPEKFIYAPYLADPRQSRTSTKVQFPIEPKKGNITIENVLGSQRPLALWTNPDDPNEEAEIFIEAAAFSRFDVTKDWDMDGVDYRFGFPFAYRYGDVAMKLHFWHLTSHIGDEYLSREKDRKRDSYHLDELSLALSWHLAPRFRLYGEIGYGFYTGPATEEGRVQLGAEWLGEPWGEKTTPFAAADVQTREEIDWHGNVCVAAGVIFRSRPDVPGFRFLVEYYRGHDQQTQFKGNREHYVAFGAAADF